MRKLVLCMGIFGVSLNVFGMEKSYSTPMSFSSSSMKELAEKYLDIPQFLINLGQNMVRKQKKAEQNEFSNLVGRYNLAPLKALSKKKKYMLAFVGALDLADLPIEFKFQDREAGITRLIKTKLHTIAHVEEVVGLLKFMVEHIFEYLIYKEMKRQDIERIQRHASIDKTIAEEGEQETQEHNSGPGSYGITLEPVYHDLSNETDTPTKSAELDEKKLESSESKTDSSEETDEEAEARYDWFSKSKEFLKKARYCIRRSPNLPERKKKKIRLGKRKESKKKTQEGVGDQIFQAIKQLEAILKSKELVKSEKLITPLAEWLKTFFGLNLKDFCDLESLIKLSDNVYGSYSDEQRKLYADEIADCFVVDGLARHFGDFADDKVYLDEALRSVITLAITFITDKKACFEHLMEGLIYLRKLDKIHDPVQRKAMRKKLMNIDKEEQ